MPLSPQTIYRQEFQSKSIVLMMGYCMLAAAMSLLVMVVAQRVFNLQANPSSGLIGGGLVVATYLANVKARQAARKKCAELGVLDQLCTKKVIEWVPHNSHSEDYELWLDNHQDVRKWHWRWTIIVLMALAGSWFLPAFIQDLSVSLCVLLVVFAGIMVMDFRNGRFPLVGVNATGVRLERRFFSWDKIAAVELERDIGPENASVEKPYLTIRLLDAEKKILAQCVIPPLKKLAPEDYNEVERSLILHLYGEIKCQG